MRILQRITPPRQITSTGVRLRLYTPASDIWVALKNGERTLASARVAPAAVAAAGGWTDALWSPVHILAGQELTIEVSCSDTQTEIGIARMGERDPDANAWASKVADIGDLGIVDEATGEVRTIAGMLSMQLLSAAATATTHEVPLGTHALTGCTDLCIIAASAIPDTAAQVAFRIELGADTYTAAANQRIELKTAYTGPATITALLSRAAQGLSPILAPGTELAWGSMDGVADYIGNAFDTVGSTRLRVIYSALIPSGSSVVAQMQPATASESDPWEDLPFIESSANTAGFIQYEHQAPIAAPAMRVRLVLSGLPQARPIVDDLRAIALT